MKDVDPLAWEWDNGILSSVCSLAIRCIQLNRSKRPTTNELVEKLLQLVRLTDHNGGCESPQMITAFDNLNLNEST